MKITAIITSLGCCGLILLVGMMAQDKGKYENWTKLRAETLANLEAAKENVAKAQANVNLADAVATEAKKDLASTEELRQSLSRLPFLITLGNPTDTNRYLVKFSGYQILLNVMTNAPGSRMVQVATNMWVESDFVKEPSVSPASIFDVPEKLDDNTIKTAEEFVARESRSHMTILPYIVKGEELKAWKLREAIAEYRKKQTNK